MEVDRERPPAAPRDLAIAILERKWTPDILALLRDGPRRFSELYQLIPPVSHKVLIQQLRSLERAQVIVRRAGDAPRNVVYELGPSGRAVLPIMDQLEEWGRAHLVHGETTLANGTPEEKKRRSGETEASREAQTKRLPPSTELRSPDLQGA